MVDTDHLNPTLKQKLDDLVAAVKQAGGSPTITSGYRSYQDQERLYNSGNGGVPVAKPGSSLHEKGLAADVTGDPNTTKLLHTMAAQFGLSFPFGNDPVHVQLADGKAAANAPATGATATGTPTSAAPSGPLPLIDRLMYISQNLGLPATSPAAAAPDTSLVGAPDTSLVAQPSTNLVAPPAASGTSPTQSASASDSTVPAAAPGTTTAALQSSGSEAAPSGNYAALFNTAGQKYGVSPALLSAMAKQESGYNPDAKSGAGAVGLMQFMPGTAHGLGIDPSNPVQAVDGAARLMAGYLKQYGGSVDKALAAYNAGPGAVAHYNGVPPYSETQNYVKNIKASMGAAGSND